MFRNFAYYKVYELKQVRNTRKHVICSSSDMWQMRLLLQISTYSRAIAIYFWDGRKLGRSGCFGISSTKSIGAGERGKEEGKSCSKLHYFIQTVLVKKYSILETKITYYYLSLSLLDGDGNPNKSELKYSSMRYDDVGIGSLWAHFASWSQ